MVNISLIVLSINKQKYLRNQLKQYHDKPVHLILADGSDSDWGSGFSGESGRMAWSYFQISGPNTFWLRMNEALRRVETPFVAFLDDEDYMTWSGLTRAARFLQENPEYSSAGGTYSFALSVGRRTGLVSAPNGSEYQLIDASRHLRLDQLFSDRRTAHIYYQLHRTQNLLAFAKEFVDLPSYIPLVHAVRAVGVFCALAGKWKSFSQLFLVRRQLDSADKTYTNPSTSMTTDTCRQIAVRVLKALSSTELNREVAVTDLEINRLALKIQNRYQKRPESFSDKNTRGIKKPLQKFLFWLFDFSPTIYGLLRPHSLKTVLDHLQSLGEESDMVRQELLMLESLWVQGSD